MISTSKGISKSILTDSSSALQSLLDENKNPSPKAVLHYLY